MAAATEADGGALKRRRTLFVDVDEAFRRRKAKKEKMLYEAHRVTEFFQMKPPSSVGKDLTNVSNSAFKNFGLTAAMTSRSCLYLLVATYNMARLPYDALPTPWTWGTPLQGHAEGHSPLDYDSELAESLDCDAPPLDCDGCAEEDRNGLHAEPHTPATNGICHHPRCRRHMPYVNLMPGTIQTGISIAHILICRLCQLNLVCNNFDGALEIMQVVFTMGPLINNRWTAMSLGDWLRAPKGTLISEMAAYLKQQNAKWDFNRCYWTSAGPSRAYNWGPRDQYCRDISPPLAAILDG
jgi:hypothetical protein